MGTKSYQIIAGRCPFADLLLQQLEHQRHRHGARAIGNDDEHTFAGYSKFGGCLGDELVNVLASEQAFCDTFA